MLLGAVIAALVVSPAAHATPAPLSEDDHSADISSPYGSGHFGSWITDGFGLPAYRYGIDEAKNPIAQKTTPTTPRAAPSQASATISAMIDAEASTIAICTAAEAIS